MKSTFSMSLQRPVIQGHLVHGQHLLPGLAYIDMLYQLFREHGYDYTQLELRNLSIYQPLIVQPDETVLLVIDCVMRSDAHWSISIERQPEGPGAALRYATAEMHACAPVVFGAAPDIAAARRDAVRSIDMRDIYAQCRQRELVHLDFMQAAGVAHQTLDALLIDVALGAEAAPGASGAMFHPVLLDASAVATTGFQQAEPNLRIPLFYESFRACGLLQSACTARIPAASMHHKGELLCIDMEFYDADGRQLAHLRGCANKIIRSPGLIDPARRAPEQLAPAATAATAVAANDAPVAADAAAIAGFLQGLIGARLQRAADAIPTGSGYYELGLGSADMLELVRAINDHVGGALAPTLLFEYPNIDETAQYLSAHHAWQPVASAPRPAAAPAPQPAAAPRPGEAGLALEAVAIIGLAGRYPKARNVREFWQNLKDGLDCISEIPEDRWDHSQYFDADKSAPGKTSSKWGGFIDGVDQFDPLFFSIPPLHAEYIDPQERLFLQCAYETLEDAGHTRESLARQAGGNVGVFVGVMYEEYQLYGAQEQAHGRPVALSSNSSSIANRVSYFCNFNGPSMAINTMCSSSLTAIHLACQSLQHGECELALAGGVNLSLHPNKYLLLGQGKFVSSSGRCESFGEGGDGYVPAEGVGAVLLKPLSKAIADGDQIYGVIKGTAVNHGGKANGYTVPNPGSQADVIERAIRQAGIDARSISYVEAHGTGTSLGDPIEIAGLSRVFRRHTQDRQFCAIGSAKSNIGHCESAAGIAALTKVLLQMRHGQLAPSLHSAIPNPHIDFAASPFVVQQSLADWPRPRIDVAGALTEVPRIAGISSFGAGGSNAHLVIEEAPRAAAVADAVAGAPRAALIVLSAKDARGLREVVRLLHEALGGCCAGADLADIACTLQLGREAMAERLAVAADSHAGLAGKLKAWLDAQEDAQAIAGVHRGVVSHGQHRAEPLTPAQMEVLADAWTLRAEAAGVLDAWVGGKEVDWARLQGAAPARRISLPTYPFARERYWIPQVAAQAEKPAVSASQLHPLLHRNVSDWTGPRFSTIVPAHTAQRRIRQRQAVSGAVCLEMARAGYGLAAGDQERDSAMLRLSGVSWPHCLVQTASLLQLDLSLYQEESGEVAFEVFNGAAEGEQLLYCEGRASMVPRAAPETADLEALRSQCGNTRLSSQQCYEWLQDIGLSYAPSQRAIGAVYLGEQLMLAQLALPVEALADAAQQQLHPLLLEAALQAAASFAFGAADCRQLLLPAALRRIDILRGCTPAMWALARPGAVADAAHAGTLLDIDLLDDTGALCVRMTGLALREADADAGTVAATLLLQAQWQAHTDAAAAPPVYARHVVMLCGFDGVDGVDGLNQQRLSSELGAQCLVLPHAGAGAAGAFNQCAQAVFGQVRAMLEAAAGGAQLLQVVVPGHGEGQALAGLAGLLDSAQLENPGFIGQLISLDAVDDAARLVGQLRDNSLRPSERRIRHVGTAREVARWVPLATAPVAGHPWKAGGVYLITGGASGLGMIFARDIARQAHAPTLILTGRSALDAQRGQQLAELEAMGARVVYQRSDIADAASASALVDGVVREYGRINGILHSAGVTRDGFILRKTAQDLQAVLAPKVDGLVNLDYATRDIKLDYLVCFSSLAGAYGNAGQADYAAANAFMDAYAVYRNGLVALKRRHGHTLSVNWPLWRDGGMRLDAVTEQAMLRSTGMALLETSDGVAALYQALAAGQQQLLVLHGDLARLGRLGAAAPAPAVSAPEPQQPALTAALGQQLKKMFGSVLKLSVEKIDLDQGFEYYGVDSVLVTQLNARLEEVFGALPKTLFYECASLRALGAYLLARHRPACLQWSGVQSPGEALPAAAAPGATDLAAGAVAPRRARKALARSAGPGRVGAAAPLQRAEREAIAIIGVSGRYPQARNIDEFWANLRAGRDCISEIPAERWALDGFFDSTPGAGASYSKWGGFVDGFAEFDPLFFRISPLEALGMDPQERLFVETCWSVLEDAGYTREQLLQQYGSRVGVFAGVTKTGFELYGAQPGSQVLPRTSFASVANRVSYLLDLKGPSMPIDTMCSSSLTAIHEACEHIHRGECDMAIAGGVNLYLHPSNYTALCSQRMLSEDGQCKSFGANGNGFVPGEGVGAVLLKRLSAAEADQDHIYGVIRASSINHGGKTNGYMVPNPQVQAEVIRDALDKAGIDARSVSYIEAHGTGTALGDPIEIRGLAQAFGRDTQERQFCAIGSAKSNIGHCESAAGIAGLTKVLLQMRHGQLAPSLHARALNPNIDFSATPFVVQQELADWTRPSVSIDGVLREYPRIAGVSSFGAGGANAHVVLQEYVAAARPAMDGADPVPALIVLSARSAERLQAQATQLLAALARLEEEGVAVADIAYTLQLGREAMQERLAFSVADMAELRQRLQAFLAGGGEAAGCHVGQARGGEDVAAFTADEDMGRAVHAWVAKGKHGKLLDWWVKGLAFDWRTLYGAQRPRRVSLPGYPFARERYWIAPCAPVAAVAAAPGLDAGWLHPLLQRNTSDVTGPRFSSRFSGEEFFLADHVIQGRRVMPAVAYLEMARAGLAQAGGAEHGWQLRDVSWSRPLALREGASAELHLALFPEADGTIGIEIYSEADGETVLHSAATGVPGAPAAAQYCDLAGARAACGVAELSAAQCYAMLGELGLEYGAAQRALAAVYVGEGQVLARLELPAAQAAQAHRYLLHPSLLDAALQAPIGLSLGLADAKAPLPFGLERIDILGECSTSMWALVRTSPGAQPGERVRRLDIDLCDPDGKLCVRLVGLVMQDHQAEQNEQSEPTVALAVHAPQDACEIMTFAESWQPRALATDGGADIGVLLCFASVPAHQRAVREAVRRLDPRTRVVFVSRTAEGAGADAYAVSAGERASYEAAFAAVRDTYGAVDALLYLWPLEDSACIREHSPIVHALQALASSRLGCRRVLLAAAYPDGLERCYAESWIGYARSLGAVLPQTRLGVVGQLGEEPFDAAAWCQRLWAELAGGGDDCVEYRDGVRHVPQVGLARLDAAPTPLKKSGTYLITGGAGGLGYLLAQHLAATFGAKLILSGRSAPDARLQVRLAALEALGAQVVYVQADVADLTQMQQGLAHARARFGRIDGAIHAAGLEGKTSLPDNTLARFEQVLAPKVAGTLVLSDILQDDAPDFLCYFSSAAAILGDFGSCDYAVGNRFQMAHAAWQERRGAPGKTIVINWPIWRDGGMGGADGAAELYLKSSGQRALETADGIALFERLLAQRACQHLVLFGRPDRLQRFFAPAPKAAPATAATATPTPAAAGAGDRSATGRRGGMRGLTTLQCLAIDLKRLAGELLQIASERMGGQQNLADFGFDSVSLARYAAALSAYFGVELLPSAFFAYPTLDKLAAHLAQEHAPALALLYAESDATARATPVRAPATPARAPAPQTVRRQGYRPERKAAADEPIAVIGMSGRFPSARNVDELWRILADGTDVLRGVPDDRPGGWKDGGGQSCGFVPGVSEFDPLFFEISPKEAQGMDPRQRLLLQEAWNALEDAGFGAQQMSSGRLGSFVGVEEGDYQLLAQDGASITSNHNGILAARLAYFTNASGPAMAINTACSSGLVALHQACLSLRAGECDAALAAGVSLMLTDAGHARMAQAGMLSADNRCYAFDERADGMVPGEAVAVVVLKRLSQAQADGDPIHAVIRASGVNYDGKTNGITAPSGAAQAALLRSVYERSGVNPETIDYVVTHGTATRLGDPVEVNALYDTFKSFTAKTGFCALTSVKPNLGHTLAASGLVSLISLIQAMRHQTIPASLHCVQENNYIRWDQSPFYVNKINKPWPARDRLARMGAVSAFGMSGTNAHVLVQSHEAAAPAGAPAAPYHLLVLSAKTESALRGRLADLLAYLRDDANADRTLAEVGHTLLEGRQHFMQRCALVVADRGDAAQVLERALAGEKLPHVFVGTVARDFTPQTMLQQYADELTRHATEIQAQSGQYQDRLMALADLYCRGYVLHWNCLFGATRPRRISLPAYPFARERYWVAPAPPAEVDVPRPAVPDWNEMMTFEELWHEQPSTPSSAGPIGTLVCFASPAADRHAIGAAVQALDPEARVVFVGRAAQREGAAAGQEGEHYWIDAADPASYALALAAIRDAHGKIGAMLYLWGLEDVDCLRDYRHIVYILQSIASTKLEVGRLLLAGCEYEPLDRCYAESWIGFERSIGIVLPHTQVAAVCLDLAGPVTAMHECLPLLWNELQADKMKSVRYEAGRRHVCKIGPTVLQPQPSLLKSGATYLITGGLGGLGYVFAEHLIKTQAANIVLTGRAPLDGEKRGRIEALERLGAKVLYIQADVCDLDAMRAGVQRARDQFSSIDGVIHSAGIVSVQTIVHQDMAGFQAVLDPKIDGTLVLDEVLRDEPLDFVCYFSTVSAIMGDIGTCDYAIANRFQMAYADHRNRQCQAGLRHGRAIVINWPFWKDGGMGQAYGDATKMFLMLGGQRALGNEEGVAMFERLLAQPTAQQMVMVGRSDRVYPSLGLAHSAPPAAATMAAPRAATQAAPAGRGAALLGLGLAQCIEYDLKQCVNQLLAFPLEQLDVDQHLVEFGFDSISLATFAKLLSTHYGVDITPIVFFGFPSIAKLTGYLLQEQPDAMQAFYRLAGAPGKHVASGQPATA
ncbi:SDR family NAD(P)-dependent oxidoreductase [Janthinobacterium sp. CG_S6]|uniref:SDR family NAD(P)-dependent oxidoreductase n=1 Tax=Janthinobacterium sp. CG_S6 TaxID=3071707 RepID=UPI002E027721|nr:polyketide synthase PksN [Janthinobacterium sp. CG_S6]